MKQAHPRSNYSSRHRGRFLKPTFSLLDFLSNNEHELGLLGMAGRRLFMATEGFQAASNKSNHEEAQLVGQAASGLE
jgi:hypothetical protein